MTRAGRSWNRVSWRERQRTLQSVEMTGRKHIVNVLAWGWAKGRVGQNTAMGKAEGNR